MTESVPLHPLSTAASRSSGRPDDRNQDSARMTCRESISATAIYPSFLLQRGRERTHPRPSDYAAESVDGSLPAQKN